MIDLDDASSRVLPAGVRLSPISSATRQRATAYATTQQRPVAPVITRRAVHMSDEAKQLNADLSHALHDRPQVTAAVHSVLLYIQESLTRSLSGAVSFVNPIRQQRSA